MATLVNPDSLAPAHGYSHGVLHEPGRILFVAGQIGWDGQGRMVSEELAAQFGQAVANVVEVVRAAGGEPSHIGRMTVYVKDKRDYLSKTREIGRAYREHMGKHFPAMALVQVADLLDAGALVEIEATAVIP